MSVTELTRPADTRPLVRPRRQPTGPTVGTWTIAILLAIVIGAIMGIVAAFMNLPAQLIPPSGPVTIPTATSTAGIDGEARSGLRPVVQVVASAAVATPRVAGPGELSAARPGNRPFVGPGEFCSQHGAFGHTVDHILMQCTTAAGDVFRWRAISAPKVTTSPVPISSTTAPPSPTATAPSTPPSPTIGCPNAIDPATGQAVIGVWTWRDSWGEWRCTWPWAPEGM